ncbi:UDP-glucuronate 4-epimerase [Pseudomonas sp. NFACC23-1]|uniref:NAD-dependent epimerase n=1 Tax=unclassified Pseudomonas TaxID=196821 RepID=UPI00088961E2|nr:MULTISPECIES: NAD-dependent epimerase [unclassified Pseudomonas]SDB07207.1 UDP-glucuronate 4-epimerase [Pseudomonas sp. NFACC17-2]SEI96256.1 UDP-glucuronate 4-epimerase [Pseudomonas sp. NFACC23-1]SFW33299.1 UDP-glucuronate 4-epimerase [Pseudomonas sp. NFACC16-2]
MKILVTGGAGFIGFHLTKALLENGHSVIAIDNLNDYYDPTLKQARLKCLADFTASNELTRSYIFKVLDLSDRVAMSALFESTKFDVVVNLAAQAGVRYSIENPHAYVDANVVGFLNVLEGCRRSNVKHLVYASSSSVYGMNSTQPFSTSDRVDYPISLYAATKKSNELMAHTYSHLFGLPTTGLRFFTVYGPFGRPDMAYYKFTKAILAGSPIDVYNHGEMKRDFTYIDDIVSGVMKVLDIVPGPQQVAGTNVRAPYKLYNIGNNNPVTLRRFIDALEKSCGKKAVENSLPMQPGDVPVTFANVDDLIADTGFRPSTSIEDGIDHFVGWYKKYYGY